MADPLPIAIHGDLTLDLLPGLANRHGLITGATGTGKTVSLQVMSERLSSLGVPIFMADVKGDLAGLSQPGQSSPKLDERLKTIGAEKPKFQGFPVTFWDLFGEQGHPVRATVSDMGPLLLSRILNLNETHDGVLTLAFKIADDNGLLLLDLKDLRALLQHVADNAQQIQTSYGNVSAASIGAIQRGLHSLQISTFTRAKPASSMPICWAARRDMSMMRPLMKGPRSLMRTSTCLPLSIRVTRTHVPNGRLRCAAVISSRGLGTAA